MDCDYWRDIVAQLSDLSRCNWAAHVLSAELPGPAADTQNLSEALRCAGRDNVLAGVIRAYRDPTAQPYCDLILARFGTDEVLAAFMNIDDPDDNMRAGVLGVLTDTDAAMAARLSSALKREG